MASQHRYSDNMISLLSSVIALFWYVSSSLAAEPNSPVFKTVTMQAMPIIALCDGGYVKGAGALATTCPTTIPASDLTGTLDVARLPSVVTRDDTASTFAAQKIFSVAPRVPLTGILRGNGVGNDMSAEALAASDLPAFSGDCTSSAGTSVLACLYTPSGFAGQTRTVPQKIGDVVSILDFPNVDSTGVTDSGSGVQNAYDIMAASGKTWSVFWPCGTYLMDTPAILAAGNVSQQGWSAACVKIVNGMTDKPAVQLGDGVTTYYNNEFNGFTFVGKSGVVGVVGQAGLKLAKQSLSHVNHIRTNNSPSALYDGLVLDSSVEIFSDDWTLQGNTNDGLVCYNSGGLHGSKMLAQINGHDGFSFKSCQGIYMTDPETYLNDNYAFAFYDGPITTLNPDGSNKNIFLTHPIADTSGSHNFYAENLSNSDITAPWTSTQKVGAVAGDGMHLVTSNVWGVRVVGLQAALNVGDAVALLDGGGSTGAPTDVEFISPHLGFQAPRARANGGYGIRATGAARAKFIGGSIMNNTSGDVSIASTASITLDGVRLPNDTVAQLPTCNAGLFGSRNMIVRDGQAGLSVGAALAGGGAQPYGVACQGTNWVIDFGPYSPYTVAHTWSGVQVFNNPPVVPLYKVVELPSSPNVGSQAYVTDQLTACPALDGTFTGGGTVKCSATYNGTNWVH